MKRLPPKEKKLKVIRNFPWSEKRDCCLAFCYPRIGVPFVIKGQYDQVHTFLKLNGEPLVAHYEIYSRGNKCRIKTVYGMREGVEVVLTKLLRTNPATKEPIKHQRHWLYVVANGKVIFEPKALRDIPRKWISELNPFINQLWNINGTTPLNPAFSKPLVTEPVKPVKPVKPEPSPEEVEKAKAIKRSKNVMASILKESGAMPQEKGIGFFDLNEKMIEEIAREGVT